MASVASIRQITCRISALVVLLGMLLSALDVAPARAEPIGVPGTWVQVFDDEFTSPGLNESVWTPGWKKSGLSNVNHRCVNSSNVWQPGDGDLHLHVAGTGSSCEGGTTVKETGALVESNPWDGQPKHV